MKPSIIKRSLMYSTILLLMEETKKAHQENVNLDIVIPVYNEESCIEQLILKLERIWLV